MPRYEDSRQFWDGAREGTTVTVTTGKLGNKGRTSVKSLASAELAQAHLDRLILEKRAAGFWRAEAEPVPAVIEPEREQDDRIAGIEARIAEDPEDREAWLVYSDLLQKRDDPRGELITLQIAAAAELAANPKKQGGARLAVARHFAKHVPALLGPLAAYVKDVRELGSPPFVWKHGFIHRAQIENPPLADAAAIVDTLVNHPSGRLVVELVLRAKSSDELAAMLHAIALAEPPVLHGLDMMVTDTFDFVGDRIAHLPLRRLAIAAPRLVVAGLALPALTSARFLALAMHPQCVKVIATAPWPVLERLELRLGGRYGAVTAAFEDLQPLLVRTDMPRLTHLKLRGAAYAGAIARAISTSALAGQLHVLDLSHGTVTPQDIRVLGVAKARFTNLRELWVPAAALAGDGMKQLAGIAKHVISDARAPLDRLEEDLAASTRLDGDRYEDLGE